MAQQERPKRICARMDIKYSLADIVAFTDGRIDRAISIDGKHDIGTAEQRSLLNKDWLKFLTWDVPSVTPNGFTSQNVTYAMRLGLILCDCYVSEIVPRSSSTARIRQVVDVYQLSANEIYVFGQRKRLTCGAKTMVAFTEFFKAVGLPAIDEVGK